MTLHVETFVHPSTGTLTHIIVDVATQHAGIIDPVLDYDPVTGNTSSSFADRLLDYLDQHHLHLEWILETHIHADHLTAASYIKTKKGGKIGIGYQITQVLATWVPLFHTQADTPLDGSLFDHLFHDQETFSLGATTLNVLHTPGHTPACISYHVDDMIFVGDTLFMPDIGTARTDFPGGSAEAMYESIQKILALPDATRIFLCHDYPPRHRPMTWITTVQEQKQHNILVGGHRSQEDYVALRRQRDVGKAPPQLLLPALQTNLRAGDFGSPEANHVHYIKIPLNQL